MCCCSNAAARSQADSRLPSSHATRSLFRRNPVNLFLDRSLVEESAAFQDRLTISDHVRMSAQIGVSISGVESPRVGIFAQDVVGAPDLTRPVGVIPRTAHGGNIFQPRKFFGKACQFVFVAELPRTTGAVQ